MKRSIKNILISSLSAALFLSVVNAVGASEISNQTNHSVSSLQSSTSFIPHRYIYTTVGQTIFLDHATWYSYDAISPWILERLAPITKAKRTGMTTILLRDTYSGPIKSKITVIVR